MNYVILGIVILLIIFYTTKEGFTGEAKLTDFLNTWHLTNNELAKTMTITNDKISFNKNADVNGVYLTNNYSGSSATMSNIANDTGTYKKLMLVGNSSSSNGRRSVGVWNDLSVEGNLTTAGDITTNNITTNNYKNIKINQGSLEVTGWTGGKSGSVIAQQQLCIGGTCINEDNLKVLKGEKNFNLQLPNKQNRVIDCGKNEHGVTICYSNWENNGDANWKAFKLKY